MQLYEETSKKIDTNTNEKIDLEDLAFHAENKLFKVEHI